MALKKTVVTPQGFDAENAYHRVENVQLQNKNNIVFSVHSYKDALSTVMFDTKWIGCDYDLNGANPIAQAYEHLKTMPEFLDALDC